ncbi:unnamed protein product, partial [Prorocentrum cordatum]
EDEGAVVDSEDFVSCFNLLRMPRSWDGFLVYERPVSGAVLGRRAEDTFRVSLTTVPMGWSGAVAVVQAVVRRLVFGEAEVDLATEVAKSKAMAGQESPEHRRFVGVRRRLGLPLNKAKSLIASFQALLQGGEFEEQPASAPTGAGVVAAEAALRRWAGLACFCAGYRRPLFSILQDVFT